MTITLMLLLSNTSLLATELRLPGIDREAPSGFVTARPSAAATRRYDKPPIEVRRVEEERPYAL
jgi:hypothetical protein